ARWGRGGSGGGTAGAALGAAGGRGAGGEWRTARGSISVDRRHPLALVLRVAERHLVPARALEPEVQVVLPREADPAVHLHRAVDGSAVGVPEARLRHRRRARGVARAMVE